MNSWGYMGFPGDHRVPLHGLGLWGLNVCDVLGLFGRWMPRRSVNPEP